MQEATQIVQRIESHYVGDDCIQISIPYKNAMTILSQDGILFHGKSSSNQHINKYLEDERRTKFPYSNIPISYSKKLFGDRICHTNQILDFEKPYICIGDNHIIERFVVKDNKQAILIKYAMKSKKHTKHMTYDELVKFVENKDTNEQKYYLCLDGSLYEDNVVLYPTEEEIYDYIKTKLKKNVKDFREYQQVHTDIVSQYLKENPWFLNYIEQSINKLDFSLIDFNATIGIGYDATLFIVKVSNENINIQGIEATFFKQNDFKVDVYDIPVNKYTLEQLKFMPKINITKEPKIPLRLNPSVTRQDIREAKQMVKSLKNKI